MTEYIIAKNTSEFSKRKRRCNTYSLIDRMTRNDLCNYTIMFYVIIGPIYQFVRYEMKTKRLVRVDPLKR